MGVGGDLGEWEFGGGGAVGVCHELHITHGKSFCLSCAGARQTFFL
jgi:hypothetical protein